MNRAGRVVTRRRVGDIVGADHDGDIGAVELAVDVIHFLHGVVLDVGLGEQHVHVAGHTAGDRVNGVLDLNTLALQQVRHLLDGVLGLRDGQTVTGHHDHLVGVGHLDRCVGSRRGLDRALLGRASGGRGVTATERAEHDGRDRPVHRDGHQVGQDRTRGAHDHAGDNHRGVVQRQTCGGRRQTGHRIEQ